MDRQNYDNYSDNYDRRGAPRHGYDDMPRGADYRRGGRQAMGPRCGGGNPRMPQALAQRKGGERMLDDCPQPMNGPGDYMNDPIFDLPMGGDRDLWDGFLNMPGNAGNCGADGRPQWGDMPNRRDPSRQWGDRPARPRPDWDGRQPQPQYRQCGSSRPMQSRRTPNRPAYDDAGGRPWEGRRMPPTRNWDQSNAPANGGWDRNWDRMDDRNWDGDYDMQGQQ